MEEKTTALEDKANDKEKGKKEEKEKKDLKMRAAHSIYEIVEMIGAIAIAIILCFSFVARLNVVDGPSMEDTLHTGEYLLVSNLFYTPKRGDIVVFQDMTVAEQYRKPLVKRVIATEGETVEIDFNDWVMKIDGEVVDESAFRQLKYEGTNGENLASNLDGYNPVTNTLTVTVEKGYVFVMGDNRNHSADSRRAEIGPVDRRAIVGHVLARVYPIQKFSLFPNPYKS